LLKYEKVPYSIYGFVYNHSPHKKPGIPSYSSFLVIAIKRNAKFVSRDHHIATIRSKNIACKKGKGILVRGREDQLDCETLRLLHFL
jgi:hypothetical protein